MSDEKKITTTQKIETPSIGVGLIILGFICLVIGIGTGVLISIRQEFHVLSAENNFL